MRFSRGFVILGGVLVLAVIVPAIALAQGDDVRTPNEIIDPIVEQVVWVSLFIGGFVWILLVYALIKFRRRKDSPKDSPDQTHGNNKLEIAWTIAPALVMAWLLVISYNALVEIDGDQRPEPDFMVTAEAAQFSWNFVYPDGSESPTLRVQEDTVVGVTVVSRDVIHAFGIQGVPVKVDALPGKENFAWFVIDDPGNYTVQCYQYCGSAHGKMNADLVVFAAGTQEQAWGEPPGADADEPEPTEPAPGGNETGDQDGPAGNQTADVEQAVTLMEWAITDGDAPPFVVEPGQTVRFNIRNDGPNVQHNFYIGTYGEEGSADREVLFQSDTILPEESTELFATFDMEEGTVLQVWCDIAGHREAGMLGLLGVGVTPEDGGDTGGEDPKLPAPSLAALVAAAALAAVIVARRRRA